MGPGNSQEGSQDVRSLRAPPARSSGQPGRGSLGGSEAGLARVGITENTDMMNPRAMNPCRSRSPPAGTEDTSGTSHVRPPLRKASEAVYLHTQWSKNGQNTQWGGCALLDRDPTVTFAHPRAARPSPVNLVRGGAGQPSIALKEGQAPAQAPHRAGEGRMPGTPRSLSAKKQ